MASEWDIIKEENEPSFIEVRNVVDNDDGSMTMEIELSHDYLTTFAKIGIITALKEAIERSKDLG